jgi:carbonic anhydrase/acetyltransferase-like protein (isoleucine patch superfamily)
MKKLLLIILVLGMFSSISFNIKAAMFLGGENNGNTNITDTSKRYENLYLYGTNIEIKVPIFKDLYSAGSNITIENSNIERSAFLAGSNITLKNVTIGAGVKIAGSNINIENSTIAEDLFIAAGNVNLKNSKVLNNGYITTGNFVSEGNTFVNDLYYNGPKQDSLTSQVSGKIYQENYEKNIEMEKEKEGIWKYINVIEIAKFVSGLVVLIMGVFTYKKYNRLNDSTIGFTKLGQSWKHFSWGSITFFLIPLLILVSFVSFGLLIPLTFTVTGILILYFFLISPLTAYYISNIIQPNNMKWWLPFITYVLMTLLTILPIIGGIFGFIFFIFFTMTVGYYTQNMFRVKINYLKEKTNQETKNLSN